MKKLYCVVYRTGGTDNFQWNRTLPTRNEDEAKKMLEDTKKMGYRAYLTDYDLSLKIGVPETYNPYDSIPA